MHPQYNWLAPTSSFSPLQSGTSRSGPSDDLSQAPSTVLGMVMMKVPIWESP